MQIYIGCQYTKVIGFCGGMLVISTRKNKIDVILAIYDSSSVWNIAWRNGTGRSCHSLSYITRWIFFPWLLPLRSNWTDDFAFSSRGLPLRNVCITKTQICWCTVHSTHTSCLQLSSCFNHHFFQSLKMATRESGLKASPISFREYGQSSHGTDLVLYSQGPSVVWH